MFGVDSMLRVRDNLRKELDKQLAARAAELEHAAAIGFEPQNEPHDAKRFRRLQRQREVLKAMINANDLNDSELSVTKTRLERIEMELARPPEVAGTAYISGRVERAGAYGLGRMTLKQMLISAGPEFPLKADPAHEIWIDISERDVDRPTNSGWTARIALSDLLTRRECDLPVLPGDIILVGATHGTPTTQMAP